MRLNPFGEHKLLKNLSRGNPQAFEKIYHKHVDEIYRFIKLRVTQTETAQDLTSEVFLKTWRFIKDGDKQITNARALLFKIARNIIIDQFRSQKGTTLPLDEHIELPQCKDDENFLNHIDNKIMQSHILKALKTMPEHEQEMIILRYVQDLSLEEMSNILDKEKNAISVGLHRALKSLRQHLEWHINLKT